MTTISITLTLTLMIGAVIGVAAGIIGGVGVGIAAGIVASLVEDDRILVPMAIGLAMGFMGSTIGHFINQRASYAEPAITPQIGLKNVTRRAAKQTQVGGIVIGLLMGVVAIEGVRFGLTTLVQLTIGLPEESGYWLARTLVVGVSFGAAVSRYRGKWAGLGCGMAWRPLA